MPALLYLLFYFYYRMDTVVRRILPSYHPPCLSLSSESIHDIKQKNGWISSANADVSAAVDTRTSSQIAKKIPPAKLHLIPAAVILIPLFFPQVRTYLLTESDGRVILLCTILVAAAYMGTGYLFAHMPNKIYSENSQINLQINALEKRLYTIFLFVSNICNTGAYLGIIRDIASSHWIGGVGMGIYIFLELIPATITFCKICHRRNARRHRASSPLDVYPLYPDRFYTDPPDGKCCPVFYYIRLQNSNLCSCRCGISNSSGQSAG